LDEVVTHRRAQKLQTVNDDGEHYRVWLWPLDSPDVAVCVLAVAVPEELALLSKREQDCLKLLAYGLPAGLIAEKLHIAVSTVHTHLKRSREKLGLSSLEALTSFAARFCDTFAAMPDGNTNATGH
jgi:DNA-binding CsgD family transcriptional regulator